MVIVDGEWSQLKYKKRLTEGIFKIATQTYMIEYSLNIIQLKATSKRGSLKVQYYHKVSNLNTSPQ